MRTPLSPIFPSLSPSVSNLSPSSSSLSPIPSPTPRSPSFSFFRKSGRLNVDSITSSFSRRGSISSNTSDRSMNACSQMPPELWLKILAHLPHHSLLAMSFVSRKLCFLAQPLLFHTIVTHPADATSRRGTSAKYMRRVSERLEFFFQPRISINVTSVKIMPMELEADYTRPKDGGTLDTVFHTLTLLPNLRVLRCKNLWLTPKRLAALQVLRLRSVSFDNCFGHREELDMMLPMLVRDVQMMYPESATSGRIDLIPPLAPFISSPILEHLFTSTAGVLEIMASRPMDQLRSLAITVDCIKSDMFLPALMQCPAVTKLTIYAQSGAILPRPRFSYLPDGVLPLLQCFRGPHRLAPIFMHERDTRFVDISEPCRPQSLESSLICLDSNLRILSFALKSPDIPVSLLQSIHHGFPALVSLSISMPALSSAEIRTLMENVSPHENLSELTLHIQGRDKFNLWIPHEEGVVDAIACLSKVKDVLLNVYPRLENLTFLHGLEGGSVSWFRSLES
ncbi:unnamed protein product, partial [Mycena citricolor]